MSRGRVVNTRPGGFRDFRDATHALGGALAATQSAVVLWLRVTGYIALSAARIFLSVAPLARRMADALGWRTKAGLLVGVTSILAALGIRRTRFWRRMHARAGQACQRLSSVAQNAVDSVAGLGPHLAVLSVFSSTAVWFPRTWRALARSEGFRNALSAVLPVVLAVITALHPTRWGWQRYSRAASRHWLQYSVASTFVQTVATLPLVAWGVAKVLGSRLVPTAEVALVFQLWLLVPRTKWTAGGAVPVSRCVAGLLGLEVKPPLRVEGALVTRESAAAGINADERRPAKSRANAQEAPLSSKVSEGVVPPAPETRRPSRRGSVMSALVVSGVLSETLGQRLRRLVPDTTSLLAPPFLLLMFGPDFLARFGLFAASCVLPTVASCRALARSGGSRHDDGASDGGGGGGGGRGDDGDDAEGNNGRGCAVRAWLEFWVVQSSAVWLWRCRAVLVPGGGTIPPLPRLALLVVLWLFPAYFRGAKRVCELGDKAANALAPEGFTTGKWRTS